MNQRSSGPNGPPGESYPYSLTSRIGAKGQVVIPKSIRDCAGLRPGDEVEIGVDGDAVAQHARDSPAAAQHLAILASVGSHSADDVFEWASDPATLLDAIDDVLDTGSVEPMRELMMLNPTVAGLRPHGGLALAVVLAGEDQIDAAVEVFGQAFAATNPNAVAVARNRLGRLAGMLDVTVLDRLLATLPAPAE